MKTINRARNLVVATLVSALALGGTGVAHAASPSAGGSPAGAAATSVPETYGARDVVAFFLLGTGPIFDTHPGLAKSLGMQRQDVPDDVVDLVLADVLAVDEDFGMSVVEPIQSGDPLRAEQALRSLAETARRLVESVPEGRADGSRWLYTTNVVATINVAGAVLVVGAAGVVLAAAIVLYVADGGSTRFDRELRAQAVADAL